MFQREVQQRVRAFEVELVGDVGAMTIYGADADEEFVGDLLASRRLVNTLARIISALVPGTAIRGESVYH